jgi:hypothetical protein
MVEKKMMSSTKCARATDFRHDARIDRAIVAT